MSQVQVQGRLGGRRETPGAQKVGHHEIRVTIVINIAYATMSRILGIGGVPRSCRWELSVHGQINVVGRPDDVVAVGEKDVNKAVSVGDNSRGEGREPLASRSSNSHRAASIRDSGTAGYSLPTIAGEVPIRVTARVAKVICERIENRDIYTSFLSDGDDSKRSRVKSTENIREVAYGCQTTRLAAVLKKSSRLLRRRRLYRLLRLLLANALAG